MTPILILGAGRMGGAVLDGWREAGAFAPVELMIRDPQPSPPALAAAQDGARLNPPDPDLAEAKTVLLAVKPQLWREVAAEVAPWLAADAVIVSVAAGVRADDIARAFNGRCVARVMPTTAAAIGQGTASLYADDPAALARAHALFEPLGAVVDLTDEAQMHAATAVSGSAPAYLYAFIESLEAAGVAAGLPPKQASRLARSTITGAAALLARSGEEPAELRRQVTSPGGTTQAALDVLLGETGLQVLLREAVAAAVRRSKTLGA
ncbi:pyrroline-5-carboxylate reductase [Phenylobacterium hankyongense]|uniref:Pyrroline-5-carboxylate reductase n=1 Tax=Phenylobacterium hankyongense TaxID=1813876 RepID=A0A328B325_9CAUL|nr:pyrroline-5-carboxylate reductase [Phenylobacterium hankyongense]RAK61770.1 pyrroline-5-carboxylate reductase [Phenylobacterium hankyongense]